MINLYRPIFAMLRLLDPETAHGLVMGVLKAGITLPSDRFEDPALEVRLWNRVFPNPVGLAAGFDKNAEAVPALMGMGFGFVEVGSVTPRPQPGNPRPRLFRLTEDRAIINRMGFNSAGAEKVAKRLGAYTGTGILGINLGKNKDSEDAASDFVAGVNRLGPFADYLVVNVSSPNTPGLRALQGREHLTELLARTREARAKLANPPPLLLKIAPDLTLEDETDIALATVDGAVDGLIVSNTTIARPKGLLSPHAAEPGGLSGQPLFTPSTSLLSRMYRLTEGRVPLIGVGGIESGQDAYTKIRAGASLVQIYSGVIYEGPALVNRIKRDLSARLRADGFKSIAAAIGADHH